MKTDWFERSAILICYFIFQRFARYAACYHWTMTIGEEEGSVEKIEEQASSDEMTQAKVRSHAHSYFGSSRIKFKAIAKNQHH